MSFLKDNWVWILAPMALILGAVIYLVFFSGPPDDSVAPHQYPMFD